MKPIPASAIEVCHLDSEQDDEQAAITQLFEQMISSPLFQEASLNVATVLSGQLASMQPVYDQIPDSQLGELLRVQMAEQFAIQVASLLAAEKITDAYFREGGDGEGAVERVKALTQNTMINVDSLVQYRVENPQEVETKQ